jgi:hypothetical protein
MSKPSESKRGAPPEPPRRRPYRAPKLERLGTLTELTAAVDSSGKNDHGHNPTNKT